jgi:AmmeMemoRadiSam system protein A
MIELNREQQITVLKLARNIIAEDLGVETSPEVLDFSDSVFKEKCGAFVTLHIRGNLRGCIGYIAGIKSIPETVTDMARASAFKDPRFAPLKKNEYQQIDIEVSILSPIETVRDVSDIKVGRDGIIISRGFNSGLLLPQVATEQGWDRDMFLEHTCYKAGLPAAAWKQSGTKIEKFSAQVFGEAGLGMLGK